MPKNKLKRATKPKTITVPIMYRCPVDDVAVLDELANQSGHTRSSFTRLVMRQFVSNQKAKFASRGIALGTAAK